MGVLKTVWVLGVLDDGDEDEPAGSGGSCSGSCEVRW